MTWPEAFFGSCTVLVLGPVLAILLLLGSLSVISALEDRWKDKEPNP